jgi:hypothetical protein
VAEPLQRAFQMFLELKPCVVSADRDAHGRQLYYGRSTHGRSRRFDERSNDERQTANGKRPTAR